MSMHWDTCNVHFLGSSKGRKYRYTRVLLLNLHTLYTNDDDYFNS